jgi:rubredoxin
MTIKEAQRKQDEAADPVSCPMCDGNDSAVLGMLGYRVYFLCRACGWKFSSAEKRGNP